MLKKGEHNISMHSGKEVGKTCTGGHVQHINCAWALLKTSLGSVNDIKDLSTFDSDSLPKEKKT